MLRWLKTRSVRLNGLKFTTDLLAGHKTGLYLYQQANYQLVADLTGLTPGAHVLIMGAGFIGCEVAATVRAMGAEAAVVAIDEEPMIRPLGPELGAAMRRRHESHGVRFHLGLAASVMVSIGDYAS